MDMAGKGRSCLYQLISFLKFEVPFLGVSHVSFSTIMIWELLVPDPYAPPVVHGSTRPTHYAREACGGLVIWLKSSEGRKRGLVDGKGMKRA